MTAVMRAASTGRADVLAELLAAGFSTEGRDHLEGQTALMHAASGGGAETISALLAAGGTAWLNERSGRGETALMLAAEYGCESALRVLLEAGADPELAWENNMTALDSALYAGRSANARVLLEWGVVC
jgi:ankyrin repeat protein